jgi:hypothetical protein
MPIDSSSTLEEVKASYIDNASYEEDGSVVKCRAFITACRILVLKMPRSAGKGDASSVFSTDLVQQELDNARKWLTANGGTVTPRNGGGGDVRHFDMRGFRS